MDDAEAIAREVAARDAARRTHERLQAAVGGLAGGTHVEAAEGRRRPRGGRLALVPAEAPLPDDPAYRGLPSIRLLRQVYRLTVAQARVALEIAAGRKNREIAARLDRSEHTIKRHVEQVLLKLRVPGRAWVLPTLLSASRREAAGP